MNFYAGRIGKKAREQYKMVESLQKVVAYDHDCIEILMKYYLFILEH